MRIQVLVSTMNRTEFSFLDKMSLWGKIVVVNQCDRNGYEQIKGDGYSASIIHTTQRGLSNSRNEALLHVTGDVFLTADDDVVYCENAFEVVQRAFEKNPSIDIVAFNVKRINTGDREQKDKIIKWKKSPSNKYYNSVSLAYRTNSIIKANLSFHRWFGAGSRYYMGEENLFLRFARKAGLKIYECPDIIATVDDSNSSWFEGYNERWFHDMGAWVKFAYPKISFFMKFYYLKYVKKSNLSQAEVRRALNKGIKDSKNGVSYSA